MTQLTAAMNQYQQYLRFFPQERSSLTLLEQQFQDSDSTLLDRKNMVGHITTSALVIDTSARKVLLIEHKIYQRWLQPGGHYELPDTLEDSARREAAEETGVQHLAAHPWGAKNGVPLDIDTHAIKANAKKAEGDHFHHDFLYVFEADCALAIAPQESEVTGVQWVDIEGLAASGDTRLLRVYDKIQAHLL